MTRKIDLSAFVPIAKSETASRLEFLKCNNSHNLTSVKRNKSEMGFISDYPHFYSLTKEGKEETVLHGMRASENGEFIVSKTKEVFCMYGPNFVSVVKPNMLGTKFEVFDFGMDPKMMKDLPKDFYPKQNLI